YHVLCESGQHQRPQPPPRIARSACKAVLPCGAHERLDLRPYAVIALCRDERPARSKTRPRRGSYVTGLRRSSTARMPASSRYPSAMAGDAAIRSWAPWMKPKKANTASGGHINGGLAEILVDDEDGDSNTL